MVRPNALALGNILEFDVAISRDRGAVIAHHFPHSDAEEQITLFEILEGRSNEVRLAAGADPAILFGDGSTFFSYIVRLEGSEKHKLFIGILKQGNPLNPVIVLLRDNVEGLAYAPILHKAHEDLALTYLQDFTKLSPAIKGKTVHTVFLSKGPETSLRIKSETQLELSEDGTIDNLLVRHNDKDCVLMFLLNHTIHVYSLCGAKWQKVLLLDESMLDYKIARFDADIARGLIIIAIDGLDTWCSLQTLFFDIESLQRTATRPLAIHGKFPSVTCEGARTLVAWIGSPAIPIPLLESPNLSRTVISDAAAALWREQAAPLTPVWGPIWVGEVNQDGLCVKTHGPIGDITTAHDRVMLRMSGGKALIACRTFPEETHGDEVQMLYASYVQIL